VSLHREPRARRASLLAMAPLAALAAAFVLPTWSARDGLVRPPAAWLSFHPALALVTLAPALVALLLLAGAWLGRARPEAAPPPRLAWVSFGLLVLATILTAAAGLAGALSGPDAEPRAALVACGLSAILLARAPWSPPWQRYLRLLAAFAALLGALAPIALAAAFGTSAYLLAAGVLGLLALAAWGLWPR